MRSEVHLFVVWSEARAADDRILADVASRFRVLEVTEVRWSEQAFSHDLTCFYGDALPPDSEKERTCGTGPFLVVVVEDEAPRHHRRSAGRWGRRRVNSATMEARALYRDWTGGGYRVHASESVAEAERDLVLLFDRRGVDFLGQVHEPGTRGRHDADVVGTHGWESTEQLLRALDVTSQQRVSPIPPGVEADLHVVVEDLWWAEHVAGGIAGPGASRVVQVGGRPLRLSLVERRGAAAWRRLRTVLG